MATYEQLNKDGSLAGRVTISEDVLKADPSAVFKIRGPKGNAAQPAPEGYELITSMDGDADACVSDCTTHIYAKSGSFKKEAPSGFAAMKPDTKAKTEEPAK